jgi:hypothetical protein
MTSLCCIVASASSAVAAEPPDRDALKATINAALEAFDRGSALINIQPEEALGAFRAARDGFESAAGVIENGPLYYNLGNTYMRLQQVGKAIAAYRKAERLIPGDEQLSANLQYARKLRRDQIEAEGEKTFLQTVFYLHYRFPVGTRVGIALSAYVAFWLAMLIRLRKPILVPKWIAATLAVVWLTLGVSVAVSMRDAGQITDGVLVNNDVTVRKGNGETYEPQFDRPLHEGVEFKVLTRRGGWVRMELPDGNRGWIRQSDAILF